jgi:anti-anti-sigma factor
MRERQVPSVQSGGRARLRRRRVPPAPVEIAASEDASGAPLITVAGEVDLSNVRRLEDVINEATAERPHTLIVDLRGVKFMDSSALHALFKVRKHAASLVLRAPSWEARRVIELSGLDSVARIES